MKIRKIDFVSFGRLRDQKFELNEGVNIIYGNNESGKSTIVEGITTLLYGIYPTSKDNNHLVNWDTQNLNLKGEIELDDKYYEISRELMSQPMGSVKENNEITQINNNTLDFIKNLPLALFKDLYCLDTRMIDQLEMNTWDTIDSEMIFSYDQTGINNPEQVLEKINSDLNQIWRESNRGNFRLKAVSKEIRTLEKEKTQLVFKYNATKDEINRIDSLKASIKRQREALKTLEIKRRKTKKLMPIGNICVEKDNLKVIYKNYNQYKKIPKDILQERELLVGKINNATEEILAIEDDMKENTFKRNEMSSKEKQILEEKKVIEENINSANKLIDKKQALNDMKANEKLIMDEYNKLYYKIFNKVPRKEDFKKIREISLDEIKEHSLGVKTIGVFFLSTVLGGIGYYFNQILMSLLFFSLGIALLINLFLNRHRKKELRGLKLSPQSIDDFKKLKAKEYQFLNLLKEKNKLENDLASQQDELMNFFSVYYKSDDIQLSLKYIEEGIQLAQKKNDENNTFDFLMDQLKLNLTKKTLVLKGLQEKLETVNDVFIKLSDFTVDAGIEVFKNNVTLEQQIEHLDQKLKNFDNSQLLLKEYMLEEENINTKGLNLIEVEIDGLNSEMTKNQVALATLEEKVENISITEDIQSIETEIELLLLEKNELTKKKNRLLAMKEVIQKSNTAFKEDYQPDIIKDANVYFNTFTNSKYDKILINQETKDIYLDLGPYNKAINSGFSRGTMDQLFLALRLGIIKHYEHSIKMPILLDEFFSNWDQERLLAFIKMLKSIKNERQVIITTCKKNIVETLNNAIEVNIVRIEGENLSITH